MRKFCLIVALAFGGLLAYADTAEARRPAARANRAATRANRAAARANRAAFRAVGRRAVIVAPAPLLIVH